MEPNVQTAFRSCDDDVIRRYRLYGTAADGIS
jgi:hypothetical protein